MWPCCKTEASGDTPFTCFISVTFIAATDRLGSGGILSSRPGVQCPSGLQVLQGTRAPCGLSGKAVNEAPLSSFYFCLGLFLVFIYSQLGYIKNPVYILPQNDKIIMMDLSQLLFFWL